MHTAADAQRLLNAQPFLDTLAVTDTDATTAALCDGLAPDMLALLDASVRIAKAGHNSLHAVLRSDVAARLLCDEQRVIAAAQHAATAVAFGDVLGPDLCAALSLQWSLGVCRHDLGALDDLTDEQLDTLHARIVPDGANAHLADEDDDAWYDLADED